MLTALRMLPALWASVRAVELSMLPARSMRAMTRFTVALAAPFGLAAPGMAA